MKSLDTAIKTNTREKKEFCLVLDLARLSSSLVWLRTGKQTTTTASSYNRSLPKPPFLSLSVSQPTEQNIKIQLKFSIKRKNNFAGVWEGRKRNSNFFIAYHFLTFVCFLYARQEIRYRRESAVVRWLIASSAGYEERIQTWKRSLALPNLARYRLLSREEFSSKSFLFFFIITINGPKFYTGLQRSRNCWKISLQEFFLTPPSLYFS